MKNIIIPNNAKHVIEELNKNNHEGYIVGGAVRDYFLNAQPKDWDIATSAKPEEIKKIFPNNYAMDEKHGMIRVMVNNEEFEVTTYRKDGEYKDERRPSSVEFITDINKDLSRRDFTINAMAYNPFTKEIVDPFNGVSDLKKQIIRSVGDADYRFTEDPLRMLRAVRFACKLNFSIESKTFTSMKKLSSKIKIVSAERIRIELIKIIKSNTPSVGIFILKDCGLLSHIIPEFEVDINLFDQNMLFLDKAKEISCDIKDDDNIDSFIFASLLNIFKKTKNNIEAPKAILKKLKFDNKFKKYCLHIIKHHQEQCECKNDIDIRLMINRCGKEYIHDIITLKIASKNIIIQNINHIKRLYKLRSNIDNILKNDPATEISDLNINGEEVMKITGLSPCFKVKEILQELLMKVLERPILNNNKILKELVQWDINIRAIWHTEKMEHRGDLGITKNIYKETPL